MNSNSQKAEERIQEAMIALLKKESFDNVSIKEILYEAKVSKSTFYRLFEDKYDVLNKLCCPYKRGIMSFVRCDIRHRSRLLDILLLLLLLTFLWLMSQPIMWAVSYTTF